MKKELLKTISRQQTERFFFSYSPDWRLCQILQIDKLLKNRYDFFNDIINEVKSSDNKISNEAMICQEITNGLFFEAIAVAIQSIEDLFALLNAGEKPLKFISGIISYSAGKVDNLLKQKHLKVDIASLFYFPLFEADYESTEQQKVFEEAFNLLFTTVCELKEFYSKFRFFYNQYKHGISVAFRPYTNYSEKQIEDHKKMPNQAYLNVFNNLSIKKIKPNDARVNNKVLMPFLTDEIQQNLLQLLEEDNLLRFVTPEFPIEIETIISIVRKSRICTATFGNNFVSTLQDEFPMKLQLPANENNQAYIFSFPKEIYETATNKKILI